MSSPSPNPPKHAAALAALHRLQARARYVSGMATRRGRLHASHTRLTERAITGRHSTFAAIPQA